MKEKQTPGKELYAFEKQRIELEPIRMNGFILDIGGGGEGIIGRLNGKKVVAIDTKAEELEGTENEALKVVMDATDMKFLPSSFDLVTSFFSLMYMKLDDHVRVFREVHRVLKEGGRFLIWDVSIPTEVKRAFIVPLEVRLPDGTIETAYGSHSNGQNVEHFRELASQTGFDVAYEKRSGEMFYIELVKR